MVQDDFERTSASGWGSAVIGGAWTPASGAATLYIVSGGRGVLANPTAGSNLAIYLNGISVLNVDARLLASGDQTTGSNGFVYFEARRAATTAYRLKVRFAANGQAYIRASRVVSNAETDLGAEVLVPGAGAAAGVRLRVQVEGTSPTTLRMKAWDAAAGTEPASWQYTATDSTGPQVAGNVGIRSYLSGSVTNAPRSARVDDLTVDDMAPSPARGDPVLIGAGDIASSGRATRRRPRWSTRTPAPPVFTLGDTVYPNGTASEFATCYDPTWGAFKNRTRSPVGNHEYKTSGAAATTPTSAPRRTGRTGTGRTTRSARTGTWSCSTATAPSSRAPPAARS